MPGMENPDWLNLLLVEVSVISVVVSALILIVVLAICSEGSIRSLTGVDHLGSKG